MRNLNRAKQNILSIGEDIESWAPKGKNQYNLHFYYPNDVGDTRLRFSVVCNSKYGNSNRRTMGIINTDVWEFNEDTNYEVTLKFDKNGFYVNGHLITRSDFGPVEAGKTPELPNQTDVNNGEVWTYPDYFMPHFQGVLNLSFGSMEGSTRTWATYEYIKYYHKLN